jgi:hypothetical protein
MQSVYFYAIRVSSGALIVKINEDPQGLSKFKKKKKKKKI